MVSLVISSTLENPPGEEKYIAWNYGGLPLYIISRVGGL